MSSFSSIQWTDTTCNGTTGCMTGCELFVVSLKQQLDDIDNAILSGVPGTGWKKGAARKMSEAVFDEARKTMRGMVGSLEQGLTDDNVHHLFSAMQSAVKPLYRGQKGAGKAISSLKPLPPCSINEFCSRFQTLLPEGPGKPTVKQVRKILAETLPGALERGKAAVAEITELSSHQLACLRGEIVERVMSTYGVQEAGVFNRVLQTNTACYASELTRARGLAVNNPLKQLNSGYAREFHLLRERPGEAMKAADLKDLINTTHPLTPWKAGLPRMIFFSDMGDSAGSPKLFDFLESDCLAAMKSENGKRHIWQWLTKQPHTLAKFAERVGGLPPNVIAMTTLTCGDDKNLARLERLKKVKAEMHGLSLEPIRSEIPLDKLDLTGIDWVIIGGESGVSSKVHPFHVEWALALIAHCRKHGVAVFLKQLGGNVVYRGQPVDLKDKHGGEWEEWKKHPSLKDLDLNIREFPRKFHEYRPIRPPFVETRPGPGKAMQKVSKLSQEEKARFRELQKIVAKAAKFMVDAAVALEEIRRRKLYKDSFKTFEDYCNSVHQMSRQYVSRLICAGKVHRELGDAMSKRGEALPLPENELQLTVLRKAAPDTETRLEVYRSVLEDVGGDQKQVTAARLEQKAREILKITPAPTHSRPPSPGERLREAQGLLRDLRAQLEVGEYDVEILERLEKLLEA